MNHLNYENEVVIGNLYQIVVEKLVFGGYGLGFIEGCVPVFLERVYPGEIVEATLNSKIHGAFFGIVQKWLYRIPERNAPVCFAFGKCGGCDWLDYDYALQLKAKKQMIHEQFQRIGKMEVSEVLGEILPSKSIYEFRNKMEYEFQYSEGRVVLGLKSKNTRTVVATSGCKIVPERFEKIRKFVQNHAEQMKTTAAVFDRETRQGVLKNLVIRSNHNNTKYMVIFVTQTQYFKAAPSFVAKLLEECPFITSIIHLANSSDTLVLRGKQTTLFGEGVIEEELTWFQYQLPATSFFQTNNSLLETFLQLAKTELNPQKSETLLDLYAGIGFFSIYLSTLFDQVWAVENNSASVKMIAKNARINNCKNITTLPGDVVDILSSHAFKRKINKVLLDPPRSGITPAIAEKLLALRPETILYISCDPATLARDIGFLTKDNYTLRKIVPLDMFPHTSHIECMVSLQKTEQ